MQRNPRLGHRSSVKKVMDLATENRDLHVMEIRANLSKNLHTQDGDL